MKKLGRVVLASAIALGGLGVVDLQSEAKAHAAATYAADSSAYVDASIYGTGATSIDMTITKATSGTANWTAWLEQGYESGNWYKISGTDKSGYVSPSSPSYRSWTISSYPDTTLAGNCRLVVKYADGSYDYDYFTVNR